MFRAIRNDEKKQGIILVILVFVIVILLFLFANREESRNEQGLEIIHYESFVGEVMDKSTRHSSFMYNRMFQSETYHMHIIGDYLSADNEPVTFDITLRVDRDFFDRYEIGDIIAHK